MLDSQQTLLLNHKKGLSSAVYERGESFIDAAMLIEQHSHHERLKKRLEALKNYWHTLENDENLNLKTLAQLEKILIEEIRETIYKDTPHRPSFKKIKDELDNAENHVNWEQREPLIRETGTEVTTLRKEISISQFTKEQTEEWLLIQGPEEKWPRWFKSLAPWEKHYFQQRIDPWKSHITPNLGEFLGSVPTTIRRYPGAPNAYVTSVTIDGPYGYNNFLKIRSGVLVPTTMQAETSDEQDEKVRITKQNLEQLIIAAIEQKIETNKKQQEPMSLRKPSFPILLQTLYSPPFQPPGTYSNRAMIRAIEELREDLKTDLSKAGSPRNGFDDFLRKHGKDPSNIPFSNIELLYSNRPVNRIRGLSWIRNLFSQQGTENRHTNDRLRRLAEEKLKTDKDPLLEAALESYTKMPYFWNTIFARRSSRVNAMAERAALEQIIASRLGMRIGSCVSGKDREEMVTQIAIAQQECFFLCGKLPPPHTATSEEDKKIRAIFIENVARAYLTGHGQTLAGRNSAGCDGLKNIIDVFGQDICNKIINLAPEYGIDLKKFHPIKTSQKIAGLNKLSSGFVQKAQIDTFKEKWDLHQKKKLCHDAAKGAFGIYISALRIYNSKNHQEEITRYKSCRNNFYKVIGGRENAKEFKAALKIADPKLWAEYQTEVKRFNTIEKYKHQRHGISYSSKENYRQNKTVLPNKKIDLKKEQPRNQP